MRKNFFEVIKNRPVDLEAEYARLEYLFSQNKSIVREDGYYNSPDFSIEEYINKFLFTQWKYRGTYLTINDLREDLNLCSLSKGVQIERLLMFVEFILNMLFFIEENFDTTKFDFKEKNYLTTIATNIAELLNKLNYKLSKIDDYHIIIENDSATTTVSEVYEDISDKVIEYKRFALKGDLDRKSEILNTIGKKYEPITDKLKCNNFSGIVHDIGFLLNNINIRHNNIEGAKAQNEVISMSPDELENWYDKTYDTLLLALMLAKYIDIRDDINFLKTRFKPQS